MRFLKISVGLEIALVVCALFSFSYILKVSTGEEKNIVLEQEHSSFRILKELLSFLGKAFLPMIPSVSAVEADSSYSICPQTKDRKICTVLTNAVCSSTCSVACIPSTTTGVHACSLGTCYDAKQGLCSIRSAKQSCDSSGGQWFDNIQGTISQCMKGCCVINGNPDFINEQQCTTRAQAAGVKKDFRSEIANQLACLALRQSKEEGACVFEKKPFNDCVFTTEQSCKSRGGKFNARVLCSHPSLNTRCLPQETTSCGKTANGEDAVYWFDSCGNKENIYDFNNKAKLRQGGKAIPSYQSCQLPSPSDPSFKDKQKTCGNCAPLLGTVCGKKNDKEKLIDSSAEFVCKDVSCIDENGKKRVNGERWCRYQGAIGEDQKRSADTPGSTHFLETCQNGEIAIDACATNRHEICVASEVPTPSGGTFSSAQCLPNLADVCISDNPLTTPEAIQKCEKNPLCFVKHIDVTEKFTFDVCVPKYKSGFSRDDPLNAPRCGVATLSCKYVKVKGLFSNKEVNKECTMEKFTQQLNDLCISLGDCGAQANYLGDLSKSYQVVNAPELSNSYLAGIMRYASEKNYPRQYAPAPSLDEYFGVVGYPSDIGSAEAPADTMAANLQMGSMISGALGTLLFAAAHTTIGATALSHVSLGGIYAVGPGAPLAEGVAGPTATMGPALSAYGGALAGAAIGFALTSFLISWTGVGRGLPSYVTYGLLAAGTLGGAVAGYGVLGGTIGGSSSIVGLSIPAIGVVVVVVVVVIIILLKILGIGKVKTKDVTFTCKPWQAPLGGKNCVKCGSDGLPCTRSACESLGQTCEFINEGTSKKGVGECVDVAPDDVAPPIISVKSVNPNDYTYEVKESGVHLKGKDECITETYVPLQVSFDTNEVAQCKMTQDLGAAWQEMEDAGTSLFIRNHTLSLPIPSLESLGLPDFDPYARADIQIHLFCQDKSGNKNSRAYTVDFCVKQGEDKVPPRIIEREPSFDKIRFDATEQKMIVFTNEPSECKWAQSNSPYDGMTHEFDCANEIEDYTLRGFACSATLPTPTIDNSYFVRCKDQPWQMGENATKRNEMSESYQIKLKKVATPLKIDSLTPLSGAVIDAESEPATVKLDATTSGGLDGTAQCFLKYKDTLDAFTETFASKHSKILTYIYSGSVSLPVICKDAVGNVAEATTEFTLKIDATPPTVTRVYNKDGTLTVVTEKEGKCSVSTNEGNACLFDYTNGTEMSGSALVHTLQFPNGSALYVKCKNKFGKVAGGCSIVVQKGSI